jgi:hypothetical protein
MIIESIPYVVDSGIHVGKRKVRWQLQCNLCSKKFIKRPQEVSRRRNPHYCSRECWAKAGHTNRVACARDGCINHVSMRQWNRKYCTPCNDNINHRKRYQEERQTLNDIMGGECICCGENDPIYFNIDHVKNDGYQERYPCGVRIGKITLTKYKENPKKYQLLCANCNWAKHVNGGKLYKPKKKKKKKR